MLFGWPLDSILITKLLMFGYIIMVFNKEIPLCYHGYVQLHCCRVPTSLQAKWTTTPMAPPLIIIIIISRSSTYHIGCDYGVAKTHCCGYDTLSDIESSIIAISCVQIYKQTHAKTYVSSGTRKWTRILSQICDSTFFVCNNNLFSDKHPQTDNDYAALLTQSRV